MRLTALCVFLFLLVTSPGRYYASDVTPRTAVSRSLWTSGTVFIQPPQSTEGLVYVSSQGMWTSVYGIGQTLVLIPFDMLGAALGALSDGSPKSLEFWQRVPVLFLYVPLVGTLWWFLFFQVLVLSAIPRQQAIKLSLLFFFSTILFFYAAQSPQEEALVGVFLLLGWTHALQWRNTRLPAHARRIGIFIGCAMLVRMNALIGVLPILAIALDAYTKDSKARSQLPVAFANVFLGFLPLVLISLCFAYWRFGNVLSTGYDYARAQGMGVFWGSTDLPTFFRLALGFGKGLFLLSPPLLLAVWGLKPLSRRQPYFAASLALSLALSLWVCSRILNNPDGSESWGARYQVHLLCFWIVPFALAWQAVQARGGKIAAYALVTVGILIQFASSFAPTTVEYLQVSQDTLRRETIGGSALEGQLPLRIKNLGTWLAGRSVSSGNTENAAALLELEQTYVPTYWGFSYSKKLGNYRPLAIWSALLLLVLGLSLWCGLTLRTTGHVTSSRKGL